MKARIHGLAFSLVALFGFAARVFAAGEPGGAFDAANKLYEQGRFADAASAYDRMLQSGTLAPALYFNLGNAFFKSGQVGRALAAFLQAERLAPRDPELRANLQFVRNQIPGPTLPPSRWQRWLGMLTLNEWTLLSSVALWLWLGLLILLQWRPKWKPPLRAYVLGGGIAAGLLWLCLAAVFQSNRATRAAVLVTHQATVRNGPLDESPATFTLHDGAEMSVLDEKGAWLQVTAGAQRIGWLRREAVALLPRL